MAKSKERILEQKIKRTSYTRKLKLEEKHCLECGKMFWGAKVKRYCSRACQNKANYERHQEEYRQARMERYQSEREKNS